MYIDVYLDTTPWDDGRDDNRCVVDIDYEIIREWYEKEIKSKTSPMFWRWLFDEYTLDDVDGLYDFSIKNGCKPKFICY